MVVATAALRKCTSAPDHSPGISLAARAVLHCLAEQPGMTVPQLARERGTSRQNMQVLVDRLSAAGRVQSVANPDHRRSGRLRLTPAGKRSLNSSNRRQAILLGRVLPHVTEQELASCIAVLKRFRTHLGGLGTTAPLGSSAVGRSESTGATTLPAGLTEPAAKSVEDSVVDFSPPEELPVSLL